MLNFRNFRIKKPAALAIATTVALMSIFLPLSPVRAADHAESTSVAGDPAADLADVFVFLNPNDNTKVILAMDFEGFIVPSEVLNLGFFAPDVVYRFEIENTGDAIPDLNIDVTFSPQTARTAPQTATVRIPRERRRARTFTAPTTVQTQAATANPFVVTADPVSGISFFAGLTDDPFYFDIVGVNRFISSVLGGAPDVTRLQRSRDSFAGYNIHMIALEVPAAMLRGPAGNVIGVNGVTLRRKSGKTFDFDDDDDHKFSTLSRIGRHGRGNLVQIDRMATPAVNTLLIPFPRKNEFNASTPRDDARGLFADTIIGTLTALGTNAANIATLASVAVTNGDYLRLNLATPNSSVGFGERLTTPGYTGFPNGRRPGDDTVDVFLNLVTNQGITQGDNVNSNDLPLPNTFPFLALPHQPLENPAVDNTRN